MATRSCLVLYGDSVFLAGIRAQLERDATLDVLTVEPGRTDLLPLLRKRRPRAILFDVATAQPDLTVQLLREQPGLLLLGVDPSSNELLVLSGRQHQALGIADLLRVVHGLPDVGVEHSDAPAPLARIWMTLAERVGTVRLHGRRRTLALATAAIALCAVLVAASSLLLPGPGAPLAGTATAGQGTLLPLLAFAAGIVLGGATLSLWSRWRRRG